MNSWVVVTRRFGNTPECYGISLQCAERDTVQPKSETDSDQSQFVRSSVLRSQCLRRRTVGTRRTLKGTSLNGFRLGKIHSAAQGTRWTQTHRDTMPCNTTMDTRETFVGESSGHEERHCRSLHETSGWIANTVAREETWTSHLGWYRWYKWYEWNERDD